MSAKGGEKVGGPVLGIIIGVGGGAVIVYEDTGAQ